MAASAMYPPHPAYIYPSLRVAFFTGLSLGLRSVEGGKVAGKTLQLRPHNMDIVTCRVSNLDPLGRIV